MRIELKNKIKPGYLVNFMLLIKMFSSHIHGNIRRVIEFSNPNGLKLDFTIYPMNTSYASYEAALLEPAVNGGLNVVFTYFVYPALYRDAGLLKLAGTGLAAELGGDYLYKNFMPNVKY